mmetsp:Transcript_20219/g.51667  ORF Transcript_20219/g.51667 Transcript_20219/m.51667 type:complete len:470 (+) Transcript_20219:261-1670(+)|eukprot:CAMPEP_0113905398 /NCGR_PEP_ID=MMETSP0780_2-20120614/23983_1 /TAXON_ID=652834 /ORGANISM="Palpitomonas bilix" /LENGTH=469 /DNA_ID=CAMNT_0000899509 /DNA_START=212 /DNA_END=1621 /DNA_ORIENTATION=- /assembly_acc=CAM_ASM_000599
MGWRSLLPKRRSGAARKAQDLETATRSVSSTFAEGSRRPAEVVSERAMSYSFSGVDPDAVEARRAVQGAAKALYGSVPVQHDPKVDGSKEAKEGDVAAASLRSRAEKFNECLTSPNVDMTVLKDLAWRGIPMRIRPMAWRLLLGFLPSNQERRSTVLVRRRTEYWDNVEKDFNVPDDQKTKEQLAIIKQIRVDVPRTSPEVPIFQHPALQDILERILYIWALRHTATLYVQGINDLVTPFLAVFLAEADEERLGGILTGEEGVGSQFTRANHPDAKREVKTVTKDDGSIVTEEVVEVYKDVGLPDAPILRDIEADAYHCMTKLVDFIQNNYTPNQPEIQRSVYQLKAVVNRVCKDLHDHLANENLQFIQFSFRWFNCLLMRELPLRLIIRLWDTYLAEGKAFASLHVYVCAALMNKLKKELMSMDFQEMIVYIQHLPTEKWTERDVEELCSMAFYYRSVYGDAPAHLHS